MSHSSSYAIPSGVSAPDLATSGRRCYRRPFGLGRGRTQRTSGNSLFYSRPPRERIFSVGGRGGVFGAMKRDSGAMRAGRVTEFAMGVEYVAVLDAEISEVGEGLADEG